MRLPPRSVATPLALLALLAPALGYAGHRVFLAQQAEPFDVRTVPRGSSLGWLSEALRLSVANYYWLQTVQYIGDQHLRRGDYAKLFPLIDLVTDLDPGHGYAYQTASIALASAGRLEESDAILRKGIERGPNWWTYPFYLAFNEFYYRGDYPAAARWAEQAARTPGASPNMAKLALSLKVKSGDPDDAVRFLAEMRGTARDEKTAEILEEQYRIAVLQRDFATLDAAVERFRAERGRDPSSLGELVSSGILQRIPPEPFGGAYVWRDGGVHSTGRDFRFPARDSGHVPYPRPPQREAR